MQREFILPVVSILSSFVLIHFSLRQKNVAEIFKKTFASFLFFGLTLISLSNLLTNIQDEGVFYFAWVLRGSAMHVAIILLGFFIVLLTKYQTVVSFRGFVAAFIEKPSLSIIIYTLYYIGSFIVLSIVNPFQPIRTFSGEMNLGVFLTVNFLSIVVFLLFSTLHLVSYVSSDVIIKSFKKQVNYIIQGIVFISVGLNSILTMSLITKMDFIQIEAIIIFFSIILMGFGLREEYLFKGLLR